MVYDVIVVGSGPAGAIAAARLSAAGKAVLLLDQQPFPRDKVCGDGMPLEVMKLLAACDIPVNHTSLAHNHITTLMLSGPAGLSTSIQENSQRHYALVARRYDFDLLLHQHALHSGANFQVGRVTAPLLNGDQVCGVEARINGKSQQFEAQHVVAADGATSLLNRRLRVTPNPPKAIAIRAYGSADQPLEPAVRFYFQRGLLPGYAWLFPLSDHAVNVGIYIHQDTHQPTVKLEERLGAFLDDLKHEFRIQLDASTVKTWSLPLYDQPFTRRKNNMMLVGDAGHFINALTGGGIYSALKTGLHAADHILNHTDYDSAWQQSVAGSLRTSRRLTTWVASRPPLLNGLILSTHISLFRKRLGRMLAGDHF